MKQLIKWSLLGVFLLLISACGEEVSVSSEEIFSNIIETDDQPISYYGEGKITVYQDDGVSESILFTEYAGTNGEKKMITIEEKSGIKSTAVINQDILVNYQEGSETAQQIDLTGTESPLTFTQKEQFSNMLDMMQDSHSLEMMGEEEVMELDTYHIKLTADSKSSLLGDMEFWVDQKTWFIVKANSASGEIRTETEYTTIEFNPSFEEDTFTLDLPEGVEMEALDDNIPEPGTIEEAVEALGADFLVIDEEQQQLDRIEIHEFDGELNRTEVTLYYVNEEIPSFSVSVFPTPQGEGMELNNDAQLRGLNAELMEEIRNISWDEQGLRYSVMIDHPDITMEEIKKILEKMKLSSEL
ncbi:LolA family protein [Aquibacillus rhizosphaerae]|uniref:Outer membrane lipoprotein-sorting protein n=1 Tax=Aquibacillus rhizosphaerae TaxID=3051431 RepID=A0ABT7LB76_9BACI|nr:hypothetical protein [Aquibacillus sp. LR5S19]MDL4843107.1 hypothetical protein [Aquibacillus sp. LR5S19]